MLLPEEVGHVAAERIRQMDALVREVGRSVCGVDYLRLSVGAASFPEDGNDVEELFVAADARM